MTATSTSWKRQPFTAGVSLPYTAEFTAEEFSRLEAGLIPQQMEDKWFIYFEAPYLYFHRSWLGEGVYRVQLQPSGDGAKVIEASWDEDQATRRPGATEYEAVLLDFLLSNLLLGQSKPFPRPHGVAEPAPGVLQHHVAGTAYPETTLDAGASGTAPAMEGEAVDRRALIAAVEESRTWQRIAKGGLLAGGLCFGVANSIDPYKPVAATALRWIAPVVVVASSVPFWLVRCPKCRCRYHSLRSVFRNVDEPGPCASCGFDIGAHLPRYGRPRFDR